MWLDLDEVKVHLRIDHDLEDAYLAQLIDAAEDYISRYLNRSVPWTEDPGSDSLSESSSESSSEIVPASVRQAGLMIVADLYQNREAQGAAIHPNPAVLSMLSLYRVGLGV